jgi:hypothetical protein
MRATGQPRDEAAKVFDALVPLGAGGDRTRDALFGGGGKRDGHVAHILDRRRSERLTERRNRGAGWVPGAVVCCRVRRSWAATETPPVMSAPASMLEKYPGNA